MAGPTLRLNLDASGVKQGARDANMAMDSVKAKSTQTASAVDQMGSRFNKFANMSGKSRFIFQNTANQLGDIAVQASMGTNIFRVLGMQLPQIAGGFALLGGAIGPVMAVLGVVAAVGFPIIAMFTSLGDAGEDAADKLDDLSDAVDAVSRRIDKAKTPTEDAAEKYGYYAEQVRRATIAVAKLEKQEAQRRASEAYAGIAAEARNITDVAKAFDLLKNSQTAMLSKSADAFLEIQQVYGTTTESTKRLIQAFVDLNEAEDVNSKIKALTKLSEELSTAETLSEEGRKATLALAKQAATVIEEFARIQTLGTELTTGFTIPLKLQLSTQSALAADLFDPRNGKSLTQLMREGVDISGALSGSNLTSPRSKKGKTAAQKALDKEKTKLENFAKTFKPVLTATQEYQKNMEKLNRAREIGAITEKEHAAATTIATQKYQIATGELIDYTSVANAFANSLENSIMSLVDGTISVQDAFKSMATMVIKELFRVLVVQRMVNAAMGIFEYAPAMGGGYVKMPPVSGVGAYGGPVTAGQGIVVGERGPEIFYPQTNGTIQPNNSGGQVVVNQTFNVSTGVQQTVRAEIRTLMPQIADAAKSAVVDAKRRGGSFGRAFS